MGIDIAVTERTRTVDRPAELYGYVINERTNFFPSGFQLGRFDSPNPIAPLVFVTLKLIGEFLEFRILQFGGFKLLRIHSELSGETPAGISLLGNLPQDAAE